METFSIECKDWRNTQYKPVEDHEHNIIDQIEFLHLMSQIVPIVVEVLQWLLKHW